MGFWGDFEEKSQKCKNWKIWALLGSLLRTHVAAWPRCQNGTPRVRRGVAKLRRGEGLRRSIAMLRHGITLFTDMCFCHVLLLRYSEDLSIGLMRTIEVYEKSIHVCKVKEKLDRTSSPR